MELKCIDEIRLSDASIDKNRASADLVLIMNGKEKVFRMRLKYEHELGERDIDYVRLAFLYPQLNYLPFCREVTADFPLAREDVRFIDRVSGVIAGEIIVNKFLRRKNVYFEEYGEIMPQDPADLLNELATVSCQGISETEKYVPDRERFAVMSSGGKDSLLSYALLDELGYEAHPVYMQESGGHWRTAKTAYDHQKRTEGNTTRIWTNIDRYYGFMLDHLAFVRPDWRYVWADYYPVRNFVFPHYQAASVPVCLDRDIGNLVMGNEFDDPWGLEREYEGIRHYYDIFDQSGEYDALATRYYHDRGIALNQISVVRSLTSLVEQRILSHRYPELTAVQRSCHSCRIEGGKILPCGRCSKCRGVLLFMLANGIDPRALGYEKGHVDALPGRLDDLKLDPAEKEHAVYLAGIAGGAEHPHVETVHKGKEYFSDMDDKLVHELLSVFRQYTTGTSTLGDSGWITREWEE